MRLLNVETYELQDLRQDVTYAILSHRWYEEEITFENLDAVQLKNEAAQSPQLDKIRGACARAKENRLGWIWIDSCCINKDSSQELARSINSMFQWYQKAAICYTYLSDVEGSLVCADSSKRETPAAQPRRAHSEWFERGWTLQELLAPNQIIFFDRNWQSVGTKAELAIDISRITGIEVPYLTGAKDFRSASIAKRLSWQAHRRTTEVEDMTYSLFGVLGVHLVPTYGEGRQAFQRLQAEILRTQKDESIFAWTAPAGGLPSHSRPWASDQWGLLAPSPECFANSHDITVDGPSRGRPPGELASVAEGVKFPMPVKEKYKGSGGGWLVLAYVVTIPTIIVPALILVYSRYRHSHRKETGLTLNCWRKNEYGQLKAVQVFLNRDTKGDELWRRCRCAELGFVDRIPSGGSTAITILQPHGVNWPD